jgi:hypothetical protein
MRFDGTRGIVTAVALLLSALALAAPEDERAVVGEPDAAERLARVRDRFPELVEALDAPPAVDFRVFGQPGGEVTLWCPATLFSLRPGGTWGGCRKVTFRIGARSLSAEVPSDGGPGLPELQRSGDFEQIIASDRVRVSGTHHRSITRDARGRVSVAVTAMPFLSESSLQFSSADGQRVVYGLLAAEPEPVCTAREAWPCVEADGSAGECRACAALGLSYRPLAPSFGFGRSPVVLRSRAESGVPPPPCAACPSDDLDARLSSLRVELAGVVIYRPAKPFPVFGRTKAECLKALVDR